MKAEGTVGAPTCYAIDSNRHSASLVNGSWFAENKSSWWLFSQGNETQLNEFFVFVSGKQDLVSMASKNVKEETANLFSLELHHGFMHWKC
jgi:hypothetical protein